VNKDCELPLWEARNYSQSIIARSNISVIAGMGIGFGNGGGTKGRNSDWKIKSNSFLIEGEKRRYRVCKKINFIIWNDEDSHIRVEESNTFLKTYTHRCEPERLWRSGVAISIF